MPIIEIQKRIRLTSSEKRHANRRKKRDESLRMRARRFAGR
jgi:hypothetical protein